MAKKINWSKAKGYECSSLGDKRFSAFSARLKDGRSIEEHYQCDVKGYDVGGTDWKLGKGKPPLNPNTDLFNAYLNLWKEWVGLEDNWDLILELNALALESGYLRDSYATTPVNQAHALSVILNEYNGVDVVSIYTDGSARPNPGPSGYGFCIIDGKKNHYIGYGPVSNKGTNNLGETLAIIFSIRKAISFFPNLKKIKILSDSEYALNNIKNAEKIKEANYLKGDGSPIANMPIWEYVYEQLDLIKSSNPKLSISYEWVKGHSNIEGNEIADTYANKGTEIAGSKDYVNVKSIHDLFLAKENKFLIHLKLKDIVLPEKEENPIERISRLFALKRWFFYTNVLTQYNGKQAYFCSTYVDKEKEEKKNRNLGKRASDTMYGLIVPNEPIKALEGIRALFNKHLGTGVAPIICSLTELSKKHIWDELDKSIIGSDAFEFVGSALVDKNDVLLANVHFPPKLAYRLNPIIDDACKYLSWYHNTPPGVFLYDIKEYIFSTNEKGKPVMNPNFTVSHKFLDIPILIPYYNEDDTITTPKDPDIIRLTVNIDMLSRNSFSALLKEYKSDVKVTLVVYNSAYRSCNVLTIVETPSGLGVYFSPDSNFRIKR